MIEMKQAKRGQNNKRNKRQKMIKRTYRCKTNNNGKKNVETIANTSVKSSVSNAKGKKHQR